MPHPQNRHPPRMGEFLRFMLCDRLALRVPLERRFGDVLRRRLMIILRYVR